jgi:hypothetical protein
MILAHCTFHAELLASTGVAAGGLAYIVGVLRRRPAVAGR